MKLAAQTPKQMLPYDIPQQQRRNNDYGFSRALQVFHGRYFATQPFNTEVFFVDLHALFFGNE